MKPYGQYKKVKGSDGWKKDYHIHENFHKVNNWWENICDYLDRSTIKQIWKKEIKKDLEE